MSCFPSASEAMAAADERQTSAVQQCRKEASDGLVSATDALTKFHSHVVSQLQDEATEICSRDNLSCKTEHF